MREAQFDGIVGPTHNYGSLSPGKVGTSNDPGRESNPRAAALQGLDKMRVVRDLGAPVGVLPPHERPSLATLRRLGFRGSDEAMLASAAGVAGGLCLRIACSASAMWAANAATVTPSRDAGDGKVHFTPANLQHMFHRSIELPMTYSVLGAVFADRSVFEVHEPLPGGGQFADEGAANHVRLETSAGAVHMFAWGRLGWGGGVVPKRAVARQTREASEAVARLHALPGPACRFPQQHPDGLDAGASHTDMLAMAQGRLLVLHEKAFLSRAPLLADLRMALGEELFVVEATDDELPLDAAVASSVFNSQLLSAADGSIVLVAPEGARESLRARRFLERLLASRCPVKAVHYVDVHHAMQNGGGPACLRLRVPLEEDELARVKPSVMWTDDLGRRLRDWVARHYRDRLAAGDLADPSLARESMAALDDLTRILDLGSLYDFQRAGG